MFSPENAKKTRPRLLLPNHTITLLVSTEVGIGTRPGGSKRHSPVRDKRYQKSPRGHMIGKFRAGSVQTGSGRNSLFYWKLLFALRANEGE